MLGKELPELGAPLVEDDTVHIHQHGHGTVSRGEKVEARCGAFRVVPRDTPRRARRVGSGDVSKRNQLFEVFGLRRSIRRTRPVGRSVPTVGHTAIAGRVLRAIVTGNERGQ